MMFVNTLLKNKVEDPKREEKTSNDLWPYLCLLRISATRPISQRNELIDDRNSRKVFFVKWLSPISLFSATVSIFTLYLLIMLILNGIFDVYWPQQLYAVKNHLITPIHGNASANEVQQLYMIRNFMGPTIRLIVIVYQFINIDATVHHLNTISGLADDLQAYCAGRCSNFSSKIRRNSIIIGALFIVIPLVIVLPAISASFSENVVLAPVIIREVSTVLLKLQFLFIYVDDADIIIQCDIVCEFYRQMEMVLIDTKEYLRGNHGSVLLVEVRKWHQFLLRNRKIVGQIGTITTVPQLMSLVEVTLNLTVLWYTVFTLVASTNTPILGNYPLKMSIIYVVISLIRLQVKTWKAENVTTAESRVHDALFALNEFPQALEVQLELQGMRNTISSTPSRIAFGNYLVLHKGVILTMFNQVVTYLIILLQFDRAAS
ncbi:unnamed protein product [Allacma fusca]|uniref:Gustatory receptor n=1 Tax=Allacma fusca TaxID=39272 RepID=A0A8J2NWK5_9HEXA|nr:unnamed protein product [Allacma fusca]